jgi:hypothetical protein
MANTKRTPERLAAGLPYPRQEVLDLYAATVAALQKRGDVLAESRAYSAVMSAGAVFAANKQPCPTLEMVLMVVDRGEKLMPKSEND